MQMLALLGIIAIIFDIYLIANLIAIIFDSSVIKLNNFKTRLKKR